MASNVIDGLQNYNPSTILEAITLMRISSVNAFTHQRSLNTCYVWSMAQVHSVTPLPIDNPLSHENDNNRHLLEKAITFEQQGFSLPPHTTGFASYGEYFDGKFLNVGCVVLENINYLISSSYFHHIYPLS